MVAGATNFDGGMTRPGWLGRIWRQVTDRLGTGGVVEGKKFHRAVGDAGQDHDQAPGAIDDAALLIDRSDHAEAIRKRVTELTDANGVCPPLLVVVHGPRKGGHSVFFRRFVHYDVRQRFKLRIGEPLVPHWPRSDQKLTDEFLRHIAERLGWTKEIGHRELTLRRLAALPTSLYLNHSIDWKRWECDAERIRDWVKFVSLEWPCPPAHCLVVVFLLLSIPESEQGASTDKGRKLKAYLHEFAELEEEKTNRRILVVPELGQVTLEEITQWVDKAPTEFPQLKPVANRLQLVPQRLFAPGQEDTSLPFMDIYNDLVTFLQQPNTLLNAPLGGTTP